MTHSACLPLPACSLPAACLFPHPSELPAGAAMQVCHFGGCSCTRHAPFSAPSCSYGGGDWRADEYETPDEYARRIWEEMQAHRRAKQQEQRAAFMQRRGASPLWRRLPCCALLCWLPHCRPADQRLLLALLLLALPALPAGARRRGSGRPTGRNPRQRADAFWRSSRSRMQPGAQRWQRQAPHGLPACLPACQPAS